MSDTLQSMFENQPIEVPISEKRVGFGKRLGAIIIDLIIIFLVSFILNMLIGDIASELDNKAMGEFLSAFYAVLGIDEDMIPESSRQSNGNFTLIVAALLVSLMELFTGQSPAKKILGITVAHADGRKGNLRIWTVRWLLKSSTDIIGFMGYLIMPVFFITVSFVFFFFVNISRLFALSSDKQALYDKVAKTAIYHTEDVK